MRDIKPPTDVDSLGKLNEWLAECGMPQRDCLHEEIGSPASSEAETFALGVGPFAVGNRDGATQAYRSLIQFTAQAFYTRFSHMDSQRLVWRVPPDVSEESTYFYHTPEGERVDLVTYRGDMGHLITTDRGREFHFYARFWIEPEGDSPR